MVVQRVTLAALVLLAGSFGMAGSTAVADLRDAAPPDVFLAVHARHNPERDYQKQYYEDVWKTVQSTRILERVLQIVQSRLSEGDAQQFVEMRDRLREAVAPIEWDKVLNATESLYAQRLQIPTAQHLLLIRIPDGGATGLQKGIENLFRMADEAAKDQISVVTEDIGGFSVVRLQLPNGVPFAPLVGVKDDVFLFASSNEIAAQATTLLADPSATSKFDDPRMAEALAQLPESEDVVAFFDGQALGVQLKGLLGFIEQVGGANPEAQRAVTVLGDLFSELDVFDYEISVEYTDGYQNRSASFGKVRPEFADSVMGKMFGHQQMFENWGRWVPADAKAYSLSGGVNLHELYAFAMEFIPAHFPEAQPGLDQFAAIQDQFDLHLDADILQSFSGEVVSLQFPGGAPTPFGQSGQSVTFLKCSNPDRIRELLHRGVDALNQIPQVKAQGIGLKPVSGMEGFEEITANVMAMSGMRPVIGFQDGWMVFGSHAEAIQKVQLTQSGEAPTMAETDAFAQFNLPVEQPVHSISYQNSAQSTREAAMALQQVGMMAPMFLGMAAQNNADKEGMEVVQEILGLLPAVGQIIGKFDFIESKLNVTFAGPTDDTYIRHGVTMIRPPKAESSRAR